MTTNSAGPWPFACQTEVSRPGIEYAMNIGAPNVREILRLQSFGADGVEVNLVPQSQTLRDNEA